MHAKLLVAVGLSRRCLFNTNLLLAALGRGGGETQISSNIHAHITTNGAAGCQGRNQGGATCACVCVRVCVRACACARACVINRSSNANQRITLLTGVGVAREFTSNSNYPFPSPQLCLMREIEKL